MPFGIHLFPLMLVLLVFFPLPVVFLLESRLGSSLNEGSRLRLEKGGVADLIRWSLINAY